MAPVRGGRDRRRRRGLEGRRNRGIACGGAGGAGATLGGNTPTLTGTDATPCQVAGLPGAGTVRSSRTRTSSIVTPSASARYDSTSRRFRTS